MSVEEFGQIARRNVESCYGNMQVLSKMNDLVENELARDKSAPIDPALIDIYLWLLKGAVTNYKSADETQIRAVDLL